jgi:hypothetical protein
MRIIESVRIREMQTLCIDMGDTYITIVYAGTVDMKKQFIWSAMEVTAGGASLYSELFTLDELKERIDDLMLGEREDFPAVQDYLRNK